MSANKPLGVGIIGTGVISQTYLENLTSFPDVAVVAVGVAAIPAWRGVVG